MKKLITLLLMIALVSIDQRLTAAPLLCSADFTVTISGATASFNGSGTGITPFYSWDFGDGSYGSGEDIMHTYAFNGTYMVCLTVWGADSCMAMTCDSVVITGAAAGGSCLADFTYFIAGTDVSFDNNSDAGGAIDADFFWSFGDGGTSTTVNPEHSFAPGTYEVCLDIFTSDSCSDTYCTVIAVGGIIDSLDSLECNAYFTYDFLMGEVNFTNLSDDGGAAFSSYFWDFGDGTTSTEENPSTTFDPGWHTVCLTINTSDSCSSTYCTDIYIWDGGGDTTVCEAGFDFTVTGMSADFTNTSSGGGAFITSYNWTFGDGGTSTATNPEHAYAAEGIYNVCLTIYTTDSCSSTYCETVVISTGDTTGCTALFTYDFGITPWGIFTTNLSDDGGTGDASYFWDFGDGTSSTEEEPAHNYAGGGDYLICLTISTDSCEDTYCSSVSIAPTPIAETELFEGLTLYPNPARDVINIHVALHADVTCILTDLSGRELSVRTLQANAGNTEHQINIADLESGIYTILLIDAAGNRAMEKIMVVR